ncbi:hypothetical protein A3E39_01600 [Candidatus Uhrbacteria bacterium RIFCSPHIGHO2_12_FULL_60_25]|uniref:Uncharacterized protein n=1 Tax=Candidatus Uhrbacteria bacterium RIFCSPHIGHO2_12_FULL_60_25 TaxID=1802399 RepID=A0A1F7UJZ4_9BACT|nr:MAG: hypothetical protein A3D73_01575 [Candidatus Uhrbacteria bacterium RIFCSPHIGHO2_02_FULL_60_44]OGL78611.1 MAG: hypothetical protein A3E39_01600 [Candidatus Uhrbacteria bacterium RIFCSPHIGHO2_12_FULL_60_25]
MAGQPVGLPNPATTDEVVEGRSWWKVCCSGCCLGVIALIVLVVVGVRYASGPGPKAVKRLPDSFPRSLTLYRPEDAKEIIYYPASSKGRIAKIITGPLGWFGKASTLPAVTKLAPGATVEQFQKAVESQMSRLSDRNSVAIRWSGLDSTPDEILRFYAGSLKQAGIPNPQIRRAADVGSQELTGTSPTLNVSLLILDDPSVSGVDSVSIIVEYPPPKDQ